MIIVVLVLASIIALTGGFITGVCAGIVYERERHDRTRPLAPHEVLRLLRQKEVK